MERQQSRRSLARVVRGGFLSGVLDITTTELADELVGGVLSAGPHRMEAAGELGVPQVVCPGAVDMVNFGPRDSVPERFRDRLFYQHNPTITLMRTTEAENRELGRVTARKLNAARGPAAVLLPLRGVSAIDQEGGPFHSPGADAAYREALHAELEPHVAREEVEAHINDPAFAEQAARTLVAMIERHAAKVG